MAPVEMSQGRMRLVMPCPLLMRPYGGCGGGGVVAERAEAEAAVGATVQKSVGIPFMDVPVQRQVPAVQGVRPDCASDLVHLQSVGIPVVQQRRVRTVQPVQGTGDSTVLVQLWGSVAMPVVVQRQALGCSQCRRLWSTSPAVLWRLGRRQWEVVGGSRCFQAGCRSSSHR